MKSQDLLNNAERAVETAKKYGAHLAEAYVNNNKELSIDVRQGQVETMKLAEESGLGLRVLVDGRVGFAFTSDLQPGSIEQTARQAFANAASTAPDQNRNLPGAFPDYPRLDLYDRQIALTSVEKKIAMAKTMEEQARSYSPQIKVVESSSYQDGDVEVAVSNSLGVSLSYRGTYCGVYISLVAGEGDDYQTGLDLDFNLSYEKLDPVKVGKTAAQRAVRMLGAKPVNSAQVPVILDPYVGVGFLGLLGPALTGEAVQKGRSLFARKLGQKIASDKINIIDDGTLAEGLASSPFDGEGYPTSRTTLVQSGVLEGFLHNTYTAAKDGVSSTGNGTRNSFKSTPEVGTTNFFIEAGTASPEDLIKDLTEGFYVTEVMGLHTANPISGDFSLGAAGLWIENGEIARPVKGIALAGNMVDLLKNIDLVGNDLSFFGGQGAPTLRIASMSVSGH
ncbi:MAG: TldD/PmbA family protein [Firmicutes bacterium]|nr:TldD/PmbA family protein [Bacillota bacterium]